MPSRADTTSTTYNTHPQPSYVESKKNERQINKQKYNKMEEGNTYVRILYYKKAKATNEYSEKSFDYQ